ncbi:methylated-DNA--[protein]-cysteine S-methyltransferase [Rhodobacter sp. Har01]|uniref:methylated-DNA--[protein]-cysteine S-methyltransferase n=1 Tax=Rhodobacter sp. Har01 TaxID=2883999 RepID=UPI001D067E69|nr:methylated-DNA--[protein]-cysteine S-methyltransferase [Rhodobacter sp. Har01]MCB6178960.1 methylated-DNA--[protein]-cysteine S-methyltransferase [Rhodobacter sp. Har01]
MTATLETPLGPVSLRTAGGRIVALDWRPGDGPPSALQAEGLRQLAGYFAGTRQEFDLPLDWGAGLHQAVRRAMAAIPFGETRTYGQIAREVGAPAQAVGQACGANPVPILIPCHRVLGAAGLGGFSAPGGVEAKVWLLRHEGAAGLLI